MSVGSIPSSPSSDYADIYAVAPPFEPRLYPPPESLAYSSPATNDSTTTNTATSPPSTIFTPASSLYKPITAHDEECIIDDKFQILAKEVVKVYDATKQTESHTHPTTPPSPSSSNQKETVVMLLLEAFKLTNNYHHRHNNNRVNININSSPVVSSRHSNINNAEEIAKQLKEMNSKVDKLNAKIEVLQRSRTLSRSQQAELATLLKEQKEREKELADIKAKKKESQKDDHAWVKSLIVAAAVVALPVTSYFLGLDLGMGGPLHLMSVNRKAAKCTKAVVEMGDTQNGSLNPHWLLVRNLCSHWKKASRIMLKHAVVMLTGKAMTIGGLVGTLSGALLSKPSLMKSAALFSAVVGCGLLVEFARYRSARKEAQEYLQEASRDAQALLSVKNVYLPEHYNMPPTHSEIYYPSGNNVNSNNNSNNNGSNSGYVSPSAPLIF